MAFTSDNDFNPDDLLRRLFAENPAPKEHSLNDLFNIRVKQLGITTTAAMELMGIHSRALEGILFGTQKRIDFTTLIKIADFIQIAREDVFKLYTKALERNFSSDFQVDTKKVEFLKKNFDLVVLKKSGFIDSISDYNAIENRIVSYFGLKSIYEYETIDQDIVFSETNIKPNNATVREMWIKAAKDTFAAINNPFPYDRDKLIECFKNIRSHTTNVELGMPSLIRDVFKTGVTILYQDSIPTLGLRGATMSVNDKPCVVITNSRNFYPTLWFGLVHELFHVVFDWAEIRVNKYHYSEDDPERLTVDIKEAEADKFARDYLLSADKLISIRPMMHRPDYIREFAENNQIHPSFVHVFNAYDINTKAAWAIAQKNNIDMSDLLRRLSNPWAQPAPIQDFVRYLEKNIYK